MAPSFGVARQKLNGDGDETSEGNNRILRIFLEIALSSGIVGILLFSFQAPGFVRGLSVFSTGIIFAGATFLAGALLGFLFGIPRSLQHPEGQQNPAAGRQSKDTSYGANTNLEQISDWLTKILVGVGLTQIALLQTKLSEIAAFMKPALGDFPSSAPFAISILVFFAICGFLLAYLWARIYLKKAFTQAEAAVAQLAGRIQQRDADQVALAIVARQLDRAIDAPQVKTEDLNDAIKNASLDVRAQIFYKAQGIRALNWVDEKTKPIMEKTIPVFKALIEADTERRYHRNHAQLAYALKDQCTPDYQEAEKELTVAIDIRGKPMDNKWLMYEFNRAFCRVMLDAWFKDGKPCSPGARQRIVEDLRAAAGSGRIRENAVKKDPAVERWAAINGVDLATLTSAGCGPSEDGGP